MASHSEASEVYSASESPSLPPRVPVSFLQSKTLHAEAGQCWTFRPVVLSSRDRRAMTLRARMQYLGARWHVHGHALRAGMHTHVAHAIQLAEQAGSHQASLFLSQPHIPVTVEPPLQTTPDALGQRQGSVPVHARVVAFCVHCQPAALSTPCPLLGCRP